MLRHPSARNAVQRPPPDPNRAGRRANSRGLWGPAASTAAFRRTAHPSARRLVCVLFGVSPLLSSRHQPSPAFIVLDELRNRG